MKYPVLVPNIFNYPFTYESEIKLQVGDYVKVPFGKSVITGVIWNDFEKTKNKKFNIKKILEKINIKPLKNETINFLNLLSEYNLVPKGMCLKMHLLGGEAIHPFDKNEYDEYNLVNKKTDFKLSTEQKKILKEVLINSKDFRVHLLQGTTGSGKTIVYFGAIEDKLNQGFQALILLPEIGLTNEFEKKFKEYFGFNAAVWHSGITQKRKKIIWSGLSEGKIKVVIGARSSLFLPFKKLGVIIVDEEHDQSYKQDEGVNYNARDMAIARASFENIPINLVTAVPSIETYANIKSNKYSFSRLINRYKKANLPSHQIINLKKNKLSKQSWISSDTVDKVKEHLKLGNQILFFINRRGFAPYVLCKNCLKVFSCPNCSINLVYHKNKKNLLCHYCGFKSLLNRKCEKKKLCEFIFSGLGVERVLDEAKLLFPNEKISIFSSDTMNRASSKKTLEKILKGEINILIGTQIISKGFHFPNLNCIVILDIDLTSQGHDLRSAEKNLQLYHQLSGRAGRTGKPATVYFQTYDLKSEVINQMTNEDPFIFLNRELELRKKNNLPPFERFISLILTSSNEKKLEKESLNLKEYLSKLINEKVLGPVESPIYKIKKKYRQRILIRAKKNSKIQKSLRVLLDKYKLPLEIKLTVDVDPISFN
jgi:primosomal protein N' (replication factor Y)|tara:strand:- start:2955 stop:4910 length:1956 start_codon:yes stop_codon:yes gene_type:complete